LSTSLPRNDNPELPQRTTIMKHLLNGVAIAAVLALATPVLAQNAPMTPSTPPAAAPAPAAANTPTANKPMMMHRHHMAMRHHMMMKSGDQMTEQLNAQELARITGGGAAPMPGSAAPMDTPPPPTQSGSRRN
jgi:hypothetical protein